MIGEEDSVFASYAHGPSGLKLSFSQEPTEIVACGEFIFSKVTIHKNNQPLDVRYANFSQYTNDNGITFTLESDIGEQHLYARIVERDNLGKLHLVHNFDHSRVLSAHDHECAACHDFKACPKSSYPSISIAAEQSELMLYLQVHHPPQPDDSISAVYYLLVSTGDRSAYVLSSPFKIVEELSLPTNSLRRKLIARYLRWLNDFLSSMLPDDDDAEDAWVALDNVITHKLRAINSLSDDANVPPMDDVEKLLLPLITTIAEAQLGGTFPVQKQYFNGWTLAHFSCSLGFTNVINRMPDVEVLDMNGRPPVYYAVLWGYSLIVEILNQRQIDMQSKPTRSPSLTGKDAPPSLSGSPPRSKYMTPPKLPHSSPISKAANMLRSRGEPSSPPVGRPPPAILARATTITALQKPKQPTSPTAKPPSTPTSPATPVSPTVKTPLPTPPKPLPKTPSALSLSVELKPSKKDKEKEKEREKEEKEKEKKEKKERKDTAGSEEKARGKAGSLSATPRSRDTVSINSLVTAGLSGARVDMDQRDEKNSTNLHYACTKGLHELVKSLLELGANPQVVDAGGHTAFHRAVIYNRLSCVQAMIESGKMPNIDVPDSQGNSGLQLAIAYGFIGIVNYLVKAKADLNRVDTEGNTPLHIAAQKNFFLIVETLLEAGANISRVNNRGHTPLHVASFANAIESATMLISRGASIVAQDENGCTPLHYACIRPESSAIVMVLLEAGADPNMDDGASTPLHKAAYHGSAKAIEILIQAGARVQELPHHTTALHHSAFSGHLDCLNILLAHGADPNFEDQESATPLHKGSFQGHLEVVKRLLEIGADPNSHDDEGSTPLHKAAFSGHYEILSMLLAHGAEVDAQDFEDGTALHNAAFNGHLQIIKALLSNQANINCADDKGSSPLHLAVVRGHEQCALFMLQGGAMCNVEDDRGMTPLHHAIAHPRCVSLLLNQGSEVDPLDKTGRTPLFFSLKHGFTESSRILLSKGASPNLKDNSGTTPYEVADTAMRMLVDIALREREKLQDAELQKKFLLVAQKFNSKFKDGIEFLATSGLVPDTPEDVARFLHTAEKLERERVGELLGDGDPKYIKILSEYVNYIDFTGMELDDALRFFLSKFSLPGEAQKIDRIMEKFAARYCNNNPDVFVHEDSAYVLSFSLIMLNTDAHNPSIKNKMTKQQFIKNNSAIASGQTLSEQYLGQLYDKIVKNEIKLTTAGNHSIFSNAYKKGFLFKQGGRIKTWKRRWFVLDEGCLYYFKSKTDLEPCGIVPLENLVVRTPKKGASRKYCFELCNPDSSFIKSCKIQNGTLVQGHHEAYLLSAQGQEEMEDWMSAIRDSVLSNPLHQLIATRAKNKLVDKEKERERDREREREYEREKERQEKEFAKVDLNLLHEMANMCSVCYKNPATIKEIYGPSVVILQEHYVDYVKSALQGFFLVHPQSRSQTVVLCCSMWDNASPGLKVKLQKEGDDEKADIWESTGDFDINKTFQVDKEIEFLDFNVTKYLKKEYSTFVLGHSVGGIVGLIYAQRLLREGFPAQLITFGQPKVLKREHADRFKQLPYVRVLDVKDPIPHHFSGFCHVGTEVVFLNATDVCVADVPGAWRRRRREGSDGAAAENGDKGDTIEKSVVFNEIEHYLRLIRQKNRMTGAFRRSRILTSKDSVV